MTVCKKCLVSSRDSGVELDGEGLCRLCRSARSGSRPAPPPELVDRCLRDFEETVAGVRGRFAYDGLICLSGGKDSSYLAFLLREKYGLKLLGFNLRTGFEAPGAGANLERVIRKLGIELDRFVWPADFSRRFYRYFFGRPLREGLTATVCRACQLALLGAAVQAARRRSIPLVFVGYSPFQTAEKWFYEIEKATLDAHYRAFDGFWEQPGLSPGFKKNFYPLGDEAAGGEGGSFPRVLIPLHVCGCPSEKRVREKLAELGLLAAKKTLPRRTKCRLVWLSAYLDTVHFDDYPFRELVSEKIRVGEASRRRYLAAGAIFTWLCRHRLFRKRLIRKTLAELGLDEAEALACLGKARKSDRGYRDIFRIRPDREILPGPEGEARP
ncbi:MAG TPA: hypothetical protein PLI51_09610 [bacterium]|nr:hypothetical protein [bacterium]HPQ66968.1 hypothetical protein [bacterium]